MTQQATAPAPPPAAASTPAAEPAKATKPSPADVRPATPHVDQAKPAPEKKVRVRGYERAVKVKEALEAEPEKATPEPAAQSRDSTPAVKQNSSAADSDAAEKPKPAPAPDALAQARAERNKRIAEIQAREQAAREKRAQEAKLRADTGEVEKLRKRLAEVEPLESVFASEEALLEAAEKRGMSSEKLVQWMRTRLSDPAAVAQRQAQTAEERLKAEIEKDRAKLRAEQEAFAAAQREAREVAEGQARARQFVHDSSEKAGTHPLTAQFLKLRGEQHLVALASAVIVPYLPEDYDIGTLHDHFEQYLEYVSVGGNASPEPSGQTPPPNTNGAAKPVTTLSNDLGSRRDGVAEEVPLHRLPRSERIARVKRQLGGDA